MSNIKQDRFELFCLSCFHHHQLYLCLRAEDFVKGCAVDELGRRLMNMTHLRERARCCSLTRHKHERVELLKGDDRECSQGKQGAILKKHASFFSLSLIGLWHVWTYLCQRAHSFHPSVQQNYVEVTSAGRFWSPAVSPGPLWTLSISPNKAWPD